MAEIGIIAVDADTAEFGRVLQLHRIAKATLGFLPDSGFTDRAVRGTLLAAIDDSGVAGYVLFDLTGDKVKVRHPASTPTRAGKASLAHSSTSSPVITPIVAASSSPVAAITVWLECGSHSAFTRYMTDLVGAPLATG